MQRLRCIDEMNWCSSTYITVAYQIAEKSCVIRRHGVRRPETQEGPPPSYPIALGEISRSHPTALGHDLVVRSYPQLSAIAEPKPDDVLQALVEPGPNLSNTQDAILVGRDYVHRELLADDLLDAMRAASHRIEDSSALSQALVLYDLCLGPVTNRFVAILQCLDPAHVNSH